MVNVARPSWQAVILDLDGTLVDTLGDFEAALGLTLADLGLPPVDRALIARTVGKGSEHLIRRVLAAQLGGASGAATADTDAVDRLYPEAWARYQRHYLAINGAHSTVYPGVLEGLERLRSHGLALACLTNKPLAFAWPLLRAKGLDAFLGPVFGGDSFERKKPDPLPLRLTCEALGSVPAHTPMVGDSLNDAQAARAAGCPVFLVTYGYNHGQPIAEAPHDGLLDSLADLPLAGGEAPAPGA